MRHLLTSLLRLPTALPQALTLTRHLRLTMTPFTRHRQVVVDAHGAQVLQGTGEAPTAPLVTHDLGNFVAAVALQRVLKAQSIRIMLLQHLGESSSPELHLIVETTHSQRQQALIGMELDPTAHTLPWSAPDTTQRLEIVLERIGVARERFDVPDHRI